MNILVVDDEPDIREVLIYALCLDGFSVFESESAAFAIRLLRTNNIDVIISDIRMPIMNGIEFGRMIRALDFNMPIIYHSAEYNGKDVYKLDLIEIGNCTFVSKPCASSDISKVVLDFIDVAKIVG
jgi:DNA-binding response OmpR family regulator